MPLYWSTLPDTAPTGIICSLDELNSVLGFEGQLIFGPQERNNNQMAPRIKIQISNVRIRRFLFFFCKL